MFVGREQQLNELVSALHDAASGHGRLFVLQGAPGIGKTRTIAELATKATTFGVDAYWGRCYEAGGAPAFWPWVQALRGIVRDIPSPELLADLGSVGADVALLVPEIRDRVPGLPSPDLPTDSDQARFRLFDAVAIFLGNAARSRPLALLLDDMHAADESSLLFLQFLAQQVHDLPIAVVATFRDLDLGRQHPVSRVLADVEREPACRRIDLQPLAPPEVARFIEASSGVSASSALVDAVMESTEGNPFFVVEVVRVLRDEGKLLEGTDHDPLTISVPRGVRDVVGRRLDVLSDEANRILDVASVAGREFTALLLERLLDITRTELHDAIEEARAARVIEELPQPGSYRFSHALIRDVLYDELTTIRRSQLHREVAEALEELFSADLGDTSVHQPGTASRTSPAKGLTTRELEVLGLVARGMSNREIARELTASEKTVRNHVSSVLAKIHVADRTQAALYAVREGLAELEPRRS